MTTSKDKTGKQKDIDDVLSCIDSLLDTAADIEVDDLPYLDAEDQSEPQTSELTKNTAKLVVPKKSRTGKNISNKKVTTKTTITTKDPQLDKTQSAAKAVDKPKEIQSIAEKAGPGNKPKPKTKPASKPQADVELSLTPKNSKSTEEKPDSGLNFSTLEDDFTLIQQELPVLDEIITEEQMTLIAAGEELPKRVITEKFVPKTTADKIIDTIAIQLADYNVTRLEYEYLHELIDEILEEDKHNQRK